MSTSKWASIIFSRTYEVDYRLITLPEGFTEEDKNWATNHIYGTTKYPKGLSNNPIWSIFKNDRFCIVGVTCMLRELALSYSNELPVETETNLDQNIDNDFSDNLSNGENESSSSTTQKLIQCFYSVESEDDTKANSDDSSVKKEFLASQSQQTKVIETKDTGNRETYGFFGYVAKLNSDFLVQVPLMDINIFQELYQDVAKVWNIKSYEQTVNPEKFQARSKYQKEFKESELISKDIEINLKEELNLNDNQVNIWSVDKNKQLWTKVAQSHKTTSLCLGLFREKDAIDGCFLNVTILGIERFCIRQKAIKQVTKTEVDSTRKNQKQDEGYQYSSEYSFSSQTTEKKDSTNSKYLLERIVDEQKQHEDDEKAENTNLVNPVKTFMNKANSFVQNPQKFIEGEMQEASDRADKVLSDIDRMFDSSNSTENSYSQRNKEELKQHSDSLANQMKNDSIAKKNNSSKKEDENSSSDPFDLF